MVLRLHLITPVQVGITMELSILMLCLLICLPVAMSTTIQMEFGHFITGRTICCLTPLKEIFGVSPLTCIGHCLSMRDCLAISYRRKGLRCQLHHVQSTGSSLEQDDPSSMIAYASQWSEDMIAPCTRSTCPRNSRCDVRTDGATECVQLGGYLNQWHLVYETDEDGKVLHGTLDNLISAYRATPRVQIHIPVWNRTFQVDSTNMDNLDNNASFFAQSLFHVSKSGWDTFSNTASRLLYLFTSAGDFQKIEYHIDSALEPVYEEDRGTIGMKWFTRRCCKSKEHYPIYHNNEEGTQPWNTLSKLVSAIRAGSEIFLKTPGQVNSADQVAFNSSFVVALYSRRLGVRSSGERNGFVTRDLRKSWFFFNQDTTDKRQQQEWQVGKHNQLKSGTKPKFQDIYSDTCWELVYSHDNRGSEVDGSSKKLRASMFSGRRIRVVVNGKVSAEPNSLVFESRRVTAQLLSQLAISDQSSLQFDPFTFWQLISSSGFVNVRKMYIESHEINNTENHMFGVEWFADTRPWRKLLLVGPDGGPLMGAKSELIRSLKSGGMLRIVVTFTNNTRLAFSPDDIEFYQEEVSAQFVRNVAHAQQSDSTKRVFTETPCWHYIIVTTEGKLVSSLWVVGKNSKISETSYMVKTEWFVN